MYVNNKHELYWDYGAIYLLKKSMLKKRFWRGDQRDLKK